MENLYLTFKSLIFIDLLFLIRIEYPPKLLSQVCKNRNRIIRFFEEEMNGRKYYHCGR